MRASLFAVIAIVLCNANVFASDTCKQIFYKNLAICMDDTHIAKVQDDNLIIMEKNALDKGYVVIGMSPGKNYDENAKRACKENDKIECLSSGVCGNGAFKGKLLKYIDKRYQAGTINISCLIEEAEIVMIFHGLDTASGLLDKVINSTSLQSK